MSIAKSSYLTNSYRYFTVAVDQYDDRQMAGMIYHDSREQGIAFTGLIDLVVGMSTIFDEMQYPKQVVEMRRFKGSSPCFTRQEAETETAAAAAEKKEGKLATFRLYVRYRYHASWQGEVVWLDQGRTIPFGSFKNMMLAIDEILSAGGPKYNRQRRSSSCRVAVDGYDRGCINGYMQSTVPPRSMPFQSLMGLLKYMEDLFGSEDDGETEDKKAVAGRALSAYRGGGREATFIVRVMFREHDTWQGSICWRENGEQVNFRSFLEMIMLMASALELKAKWTEPTDSKYVEQLLNGHTA